MSTKKAPAAKPATPAATKVRKPRTPGMTLAQKFAVLKVVEAADGEMPDATLAEQLSVSTGRTITTMQVKGYRRELGIPSVGRPNAASLAAQLAVANALIAELQLQLLDTDGDAGDTL